MDDHSRGVTRVYLAFENSLDEGYWDRVEREVSYFENQDHPLEQPPRGQKGREVGEMDVIAINEEDLTAYMSEVKTNRNDLSYAWDQLDRADEHFTDWDFLKDTYLE